MEAPPGGASNVFSSRRRCSVRGACRTSRRALGSGHRLRELFERHRAVDAARVDRFYDSERGYYAPEEAGEERDHFLTGDLAEFRIRCGRPDDDDLVFGDWSLDDWDNWRERNFQPAAIAVGLPDDTIPRDLRGSFASLLI